MNGMGVRRSVRLTRRAWPAVQVVLIVLALMGAAWPAHLPARASDLPTAAPGPGQTPLAELLDREGRLDLASGFRGSIDARGWQLVSGPNEAPAFAPLAADEGYHWSGIFDPPGMNLDVKALAVDGAGNLYAGGRYTMAGGVTANGIAKWNGSAWSALGSGMGGDWPWVYALAVDGTGNLYAGGWFTSAGGTTANYIAKWDGSAWSAVGSGMSDWVLALVVDGADNIYAGGEFTSAGGVTVNHIAKWNGISWSALSSGMDGEVHALAVDGAGNLYAGGYFETAGGAEVNHVAKWDGSAWSALGTGMDGKVSDLAVDGAGNLYAGGQFTTAGGVMANHVARWNGGAWSTLGSGMDDYSVFALAVDGAGKLYAGGHFNTAGGVEVHNIAKWNGSAWSALGSGMDGRDVFAMALDAAGNLYAGGEFIAAGGVAVNYIAKWDGSSWSACGAGYGLNDYVSALAADGAGNLYAGGSFISAGGEFATAGGVILNYIAKWDGSAWSALGSGMNGTVHALAFNSAGNLYAGGEFTTAGGVAAKNVAKWNGSAWSALAGGMGGNSPVVYALAADDGGNVYAGGWFTSAGGVAANNLARWNGSAWSALGSGTNGFVWALVVDHTGNLFAGGRFTMAGGKDARNIAKWNDSTWSALGSGMDGDVSSLAVDGAGNLYAGGSFTAAGSVAANNIAKWNGSAWSALGIGIGGWVHALLVNDAENLYAGGEFQSAGGVAANYVAKWDGTAWSALGSGMSYHEQHPQAPVYDLASDDGDSLYAGGNFTFAGGKPSAFIALWEPARELSVATVGSGGGRATSNPPGIDCGVDCSETYAVGTAINLAWTARTGSTFSGWDGACSGTGACQVIMDAARHVTATFTLNQYDLNVAKPGTGYGDVVSSPPGIDCGSDCTAAYYHGTAVDLTATATLGTTFNGWSGACSGQGACRVTMTAAKSVTATFTLNRYVLTASKSSSGSGEVTSNLGGIVCGGTCNATFDHGTVVTLTAIPGEFSTFTGWSGACTGMGPCVVTMDSPRVAMATFALQSFRLTVSKAGYGSGAVVSNPGGVNCGGTCSADFTARTVVTLTATPDASASFSGWSGACSGAGSCAVTMNATKAVTATFGVPGAVTPQASTMYYGQQLQVEGEAMAAAPAAVTNLVVFTGTVPAGIFLVGVEGSEPYAGEISAGRLINRLLAQGCGAGSACTAVNVAVYAPDGTHTDFPVTSPVITEYLYLPHVSRK